MGRVLADVAGPCPACGLPGLAAWRNATSQDPRAAQSTYLLARCPACGTAVTADRAPGEDARLYRGQAYDRPSPRAEIVVRPLRRLGERAQLRALGPLRPGSRVFEVGAGDGTLLRALARRGHEVAGTEPFAEPSSPAILDTPIDELELERGRYDLIVLWHVLEHIEQPLDAVARLVPALAPGGRLVVAVPNLGSLQARLGGDLWFHQDVPRHAVHFTRAGLTALLERAGLSVTRVRTGSLDQGPLGMAQTMLTRITGRRDVGFATLKDRRPPQGDVALTVLAALTLAPAAIVAEAAAVATGRGGVLIVRATAAG